jgi:catechol-2,3-dioxygenase
VQHVNLTIPPGAEELARSFYTDILGLREIPKPSELRVNGGLWYQVGSFELHLSIERDGASTGSRRHVGFVVNDLERARRFFSEHGIATLPQADLPSWRRFYVHDPFGNRLEIQSPRRSTSAA